ncbi:MAG: thioredoxin domain-containing protein [Patescibacteria group bacterium]
MAVKATAKKITAKPKSSAKTPALSSSRKITLSVPARLNFTSILVVFCIAISFLLGILITEVYHLKNASVTSEIGQQETPKPLHVAESIGMDADKFKSCLESGKYKDKVDQDLALGQQAGVDGTPVTFVNGSPISGAIPWADFKESLDQIIADPTTPLPSITPTTADISKSSFPVMGDANALVTVVEFADFQCPFCEQWFKDIESNLIKDYVKTGKVKFIFQNYAFLGPDSITAAEGSYCANEQGKFWEYHDFLYNNQGAEQSGWASLENLL